MENERYSLNLPYKKVLCVEQQRSITTYLNYSLPLCSLLWDKAKKTWLIEHFNNLYSMHNEEGYIWVDYLEEVYFINDVMEYSFLPIDLSKKEENIINFIKGKIDTGFYTSLYVDAFYISSAERYQTEHRSLQIYIYGYDAEQKVMYGIGFDKQYKFHKILYSFEEVEQSFISCTSNDSPLYHEIWVDWYNIILIKPKDINQQYPFKLRPFIESLENFMTAKELPEQLRPETKFQRGCDARYGIDVYNDIIESLHLLYKGVFSIDYRSIHILAERAQLIYENIVFLAQYYHKEDMLQTLIDGYYTVSKLLKNARFYYIKGFTLQGESGKLHGQLKDKNSILHIINICNEVYNVESKLLPEMVKVLGNIENDTERKEN